MTLSEESFTFMTSYRLQCDSNGFFAGVLDDFLPLVPLHRQTKNRRRYGRDLSPLGIQDKRKFKNNENKITTRGKEKVKIICK